MNRSADGAYPETAPRYPAAEAFAAIDREITDLALGATLVNEGTTFVSSRLRGVQHHFLWSVLLDRVWLE